MHRINGRIAKLAFAIYLVMLCFSNGFAQSTTFKNLNGLDGIETEKICFSPDGLSLASYGKNNMIRIVHLSSGLVLTEIDPRTKGGTLKSICFSPDGKKLATAGYYTEIKIWDMLTGRLLEKFGNEKNRINTLHFSPDGRLLLSGDEDNMIKIWDPSTGDLIRNLEGHSKRVNAVCFSQNGRRIASASDDETVKIWDVASGKLLRKIEGQSNSQVMAAAYSPDGNRLATYDRLGKLNIWDASTDRLVSSFSGSFKSFSFSPDGNKIAIVSEASAYIKIGVVESGDWLKQLEKETPVRNISYSPDGNYLASAGSDKKVVLWDLRYLNNLTLATNSNNSLPYYNIKDKIILSKMDFSQLTVTKQQQENSKLYNNSAVVPFTVSAPLAATDIFWFTILFTENSSFSSWGIYNDANEFICKSFSPFVIDRELTLIKQDQQQLSQIIKPGNYTLKINFKEKPNFKGIWLSVGYSRKERLQQFLAPLLQLEK